MSIFDINFYQKAFELVPPDKRGAVNIRWIQSLLSPVQYLRDQYLGDYRVGSAYPQWIAGTYYIGDRVIYKQIVYECNVDGTTNTPPNDGWVKYLDSFIGCNDRVKYNGHKVVLEFALNQRFFSIFRQPPLVSDIYISNIPYTIEGFRVAKTTGSSVGQTTSSDAIGLSLPFVQPFNFQINMPVAVYAATNDSEIRNFVDRIIPAGLNYTIVTY